ncbi:hypothetical protein A0K93_03110 [Corynebacterium sp. BCW_4722]|nr:hypothetical protein A0K93_03110 [Corynebacterium sp. BCW_4722]
MTQQLAPANADRIAAVLDSLNLKYFRGEVGDIRTAFPGLAVFLEEQPEGFKASARWMAVLEEPKDIYALRLKANEMNRFLPLVRVHAVQREDNTAVVIIEAPFFATDGFTDEQLSNMIEYFFSAIHHTADVMRKQFPHVEEMLPGDDNEEA